MFRGINYLRPALSAACAILLSISAAASSPHGGHPDWTLHTSFENLPRRIVETPKSVYQFGHQTPYYATGYNKLYTVLTGGIFKYDKANPAAGLQDLAATVPFSGTDMMCFNVDPQSEAMCVAYTDGGIDVVRPNGKLQYLDVLKRREGPRATQVNNVSFQPGGNAAWVSTAQGFLKIDPANAEVTADALWTSQVQDIASVGEATAAVIDGTLRIAPAGKDITRLDSYVAATGLPSNFSGAPQLLMPLDDNHFGIVSTGGSIALATLKDGKWTFKLLVTDTAILQPYNKDVSRIACHRLDHTVQQTATGWYVSSAAKAYLLDRGADSSAEPVFATQTLATGNTMYSSSWDKVSFWFYRERGRLVNMSYNGSAWSGFNATLRVTGPMMARDMAFMYSPEHGLIMVNQETGPVTPYNYHRFGPKPIAFKNSQWHRLDALTNQPYILEQPGSEAMATNFNKGDFRFPVTDPVGACLDPVNPDILHIGSYWDGAAAMNIDDPRKLPIISSGPNNWHKDWPYLDTFENGTWSNYQGIYMLGGDSQGNVWALRNGNYSGTDPKSTVYLCYWTPEARLAGIEAQDPSLCSKWKEIKVNMGYNSGFYISGYICRHPANEGLFIICPATGTDSSGQRHIYIYDTNNTPGDTSDDSIKDVMYFSVDGISATMGMNYMTQVLEDPATGEVVFMNATDTFIFNPRDPVVNNSLKAKTLIVPTESGFNRLFTPLYANAGCYDSYGRLWIGTNGYGVVGISADRSKLIAAYSTDNSPLPSDKVYGMGWNPDTNSLFISTDSGIAEVRVDSQIANAEISEEAPVAVPGYVTSEFTGTVAIHNVPEGTLLRVTDHNGRETAVLPVPECGVTHWNLLDSEGRMVPTGRYTVSDCLPHGKFIPITIPVTR